MGAGASGYTWEYGFGSIRACAWLWSAGGSQDADDGGRCSDITESFCYQGETDNPCIDIGTSFCFGCGSFVCFVCFVCFGSFDGGESGGARGLDWGADGADHSSGAADRARIERGRQTVSTGSGRATGDAVGCALAGADRSLLWGVRGICSGRGMEDAGSAACDGDQP